MRRPRKHPPPPLPTPSPVLVQAVVAEFLNGNPLLNGAFGGVRVVQEICVKAIFFDTSLGFVCVLFSSYAPLCFPNS